MASSHPRQLAAIPPVKCSKEDNVRCFRHRTDTAMMKQVQATHAPDGREVEDTPPMSVASAIIHVATYWSIRSIVACASQIASTAQLPQKHDEKRHIDNLYKDARSRSEIHYEMVWIPVMDATAWNDLGRQKFEHFSAGSIDYGEHLPPHLIG
ncbi:hypothetical protein K1719_010240 [Acacia pycnantha]|nr:hypothetical protein K1719_010240 [Acacia pycnantha]